MQKPPTDLKSIVTLEDLLAFAATLRNQPAYMPISATVHAAEPAATVEMATIDPESAEGDSTVWLV